MPTSSRRPRRVTLPPLEVALVRNNAQQPALALVTTLSLPSPVSAIASAPSSAPPSAPSERPRVARKSSASRERRARGSGISSCAEASCRFILPPRSFASLGRVGAWVVRAVASSTAGLTASAGAARPARRARRADGPNSLSQRDALASLLAAREDQRQLDADDRRWVAARAPHQANDARCEARTPSRRVVVSVLIRRSPDSFGASPSSSLRATTSKSESAMIASSSSAEIRSRKPPQRCRQSRARAPEFWPCRGWRGSTGRSKGQPSARR